MTEPAQPLVMQPVVSSSLAAVGYSAERKELAVVFKHSGPGVVYVYSDVSEAAFDALMGAESLGAHFAAHIRGKYAFRWEQRKASELQDAATQNTATLAGETE